MMIFVCTVLGVWLSFVTISSNSIIPASIFHGTINVIGEWPALIALPGISSLIGPNPTCIIGIFGFAVGSFFILRYLNQLKKR